LINERFKYYHVGIFLLDERKEYAILSASNREGGKRMLEKRHRLKVDEKSIVGYVSQNLTARIALDVGQDAVFFDNPDLPSTRSEMALPLVASGQILGVIDVQSTEQSAFSDEDVVALQILADQIAIAIQNANLFSETEKALQASREVFGDVSREAWKKVLRNQPRIGYIATPSGTAQMSAETLEPNLAKSFNTGNVITNADGLTLTVPIKVRGQVIGGIRLKKSDISDTWSQDETNLALTLSDQLSGALESARLYRESQQRAVRETLVSDISARISAASRVDAILRETVQELGQTFGNATVSFQVVEQSNGSLQEPEPGVNGVAGSESANS
jgi:GAF domain-containing protein